MSVGQGTDTGSMYLTKRIRQVPMLGVANYDPHIREFNAFLTERRLCVGENSVIRFWEYLHNRGLAPRTLNLKRAALRKGIRKSFPRDFDSRLHAAVFDDFFRENIKGYRVDSSINHEDQLSDKDIKALIRGIPRRLSLMLETLAISGLRIGELRTLSFHRATKRGDWWKFEVLGKGGVVRPIYVPVVLVRRIQACFGKSEILFPNMKGRVYSRQYIGRELRKHGQRILDKNVHPHQARHYFALSRRRGGQPIEKISRYLGHSTSATTMDLYCKESLTPGDLPVLTGIKRFGIATPG